MHAATLAGWPQPPLASSRKPLQVMTPVSATSAQRHLRRMSSCGVALRIHKHRTLTFAFLTSLILRVLIVVRPQRRETLTCEVTLCLSRIETCTATFSCDGCFALFFPARRWWQSERLLSLVVYSANLRPLAMVGSPPGCHLASGRWVALSLLRRRSARHLRRTNADMKSSQTRCEHRWPSYRSHVLGLHCRAQEESSAKLCPATQHHPRRAGVQVHTKAAAQLQSPAR